MAIKYQNSTMDTSIEEMTEFGSSMILKPSFVLIAVDTHPSMFCEIMPGVTPLRCCLNSLYKLADSLILNQNKRNWSQFGVVFVDQDDKASLIDFKNNIIDSTKKLKIKKNLSDNELKMQFERKGEFDLASFFQLCKKKFKEISSTFYKRTLVLITNDDNPIGSDSNKRFTALNEAKNFDANDIVFQVVTMNQKFNYNLFYNEIFKLSKNYNVEELCEDEEGLLEKLTSTVVKRVSQRKMLFYPFIGDLNRFLIVSNRSYISPANLLNNACVSTSGLALKKLKEQDVGAELGTEKFSVVNRKTKHQCPRISFNLTEKIETDENNIPVGITLLYVSNRITDIGEVLSSPSLLQVHHSETLTYFNQFWQHCMDNNKVLVCAKKLKTTGHIHFVELIPKSVGGVRTFLIISIPFASEISNTPMMNDEHDNILSKEQISITNQLIDKLIFDYHPSMYIKSNYAQKKAFIKSRLLGEQSEEILDYTSNTSGVDDRVADLSETFKTLFGSIPQSGTKRGKASSGPRAKLVKKK